MQLSNIRFTIKPVLLLAGAAFLFLAAGCGRQGTSTPLGTSTASKTSTAVSSGKQTGKQPDKQAGKQPELYKPEEPTGPKIELTQEGVTLNWVEKGVVRMSATASEGQVNELSRTGMLKGFFAKMYDNGRLTTTMSAPRVVYDTQTRVVTATGGVILKSLDRKTVVTAKWMKWYSKQQKVIGNGGVKITSDVYNMTGAAFVADTALKTLTVRNSSKGLEP